VPDLVQTDRIKSLRADWAALCNDDDWMSEELPWDTLFEASLGYGLECQELAVSLMLEANGHLIDGLVDCMDSSLTPTLDASMTLKELQDILKTHAGWALEPDFQTQSDTARFWYVSEEKLEPGPTAKARLISPAKFRPCSPIWQTRITLSWRSF